MWVTQYLVMKRASIEPNFHQLYLEFMETLELTNFAREVLKETYRNIKVCFCEYLRFLLSWLQSFPLVLTLLNDFVHLIQMNIVSSGNGHDGTHTKPLSLPMERTRRF